MTLNSVIALILRFFHRIFSFACRFCHSGYRPNVRKILYIFYSP